MEQSNGSVAEAHRPTYQPVSDRIQSLDLLRGVALLGILMMNIPYFALPDTVTHHQLYAHPGDVNFCTNLVVSVLFEGKMRALFSLLFGAGILLFTTQKETASGGSIAVADLYYRRMLWLVFFGVVHAFVILWFGDILYWYGLDGLLLFTFRHASPRRLFIGAMFCFAFLVFQRCWDFALVKEKRENYLTALALEKQNKTLTEAQKEHKAAWEKLEKGRALDIQAAEKEISVMRGNYAQVWNHVRPIAVESQSSYYYRNLWDSLGMMLLGMALFKWGVLTKGSRRTYLLLVLIGYGIGLPLGYWAVWQEAAATENYGHYLDTHWLPPAVTYNIRRTGTMLGHIGLILLLARVETFRWLGQSLRAVGQMAFTNYVLQSLICTGIFYGYGLGYYGRLQYYQLMYVVAGVGILELIISPIWLRYFRFGPLEWLWRSLTYRKLQPFVKPLIP
ncbi:MAG: DUF418 domain-containing protein [Spirosomataceae bacterium]